MDIANAKWHKSSFSDNSGPYCVEVAVDSTTGERAVRNTRRPDDGTAIFDAAEWDAFLRGVRAGEFDV